MGGRFGEILLILILVLLFFGPNKLPSLAKALGEALREFKKAANPDSDDAKPAATVAASAPALPADAKDAEKKSS